MELITGMQIDNYESLRSITVTKVDNKEYHYLLSFMLINGYGMTRSVNDK